MGGPASQPASHPASQPATHPRVTERQQQPTFRRPRSRPIASCVSSQRRPLVHSTRVFPLHEEEEGEGLSFLCSLARLLAYAVLAASSRFSSFFVAFSLLASRFSLLVQAPGGMFWLSLLKCLNFDNFKVLYSSSWGCGGWVRGYDGVGLWEAGPGCACCADYD